MGRSLADQLTEIGCMVREQPLKHGLRVAAIVRGSEFVALRFSIRPQTSLEGTKAGGGNPDRYRSVLTDNDLLADDGDTTTQGVDLVHLYGPRTWRVFRWDDPSFQTRDEAQEWMKSQALAHLRGES